MKDKYYLNHYQLGNAKKHLYILTFVGFFLIFTFFMRRSAVYSLWLLSLDVPTVILFTAYMLIIKPLMYKGVITGYYREKYSDDILVMWEYYLYFVYSAFGRLLPIVRTPALLYPEIYNPKFFIIGTIVPLLFFYGFYYKRKYITMKRYNDGVRLLMASKNPEHTFSNLNVWTAGEAFIREYENYIKRDTLKKANDNAINIDDPVLKDIFKKDLLGVSSVDNGQDDSSKSTKQQVRRKSRTES